MGYPGKRMPVAGIEIKEGKPEKSRIDEANVWIVQHIFSIVPFSDEPVLERSEIHGTGDDRD
jgi:hypothetical protein